MHDAIDANVRNHQAYIKNIETQLGKLTTIVNERLPPRNQDQKSQPHVMEIYTEEDVYSGSFMTQEAATMQPNFCLEEEKPEEKRAKSGSCSDDSLHRGLERTKNFHLFIRISLFFHSHLKKSSILWSLNRRSLWNKCSHSR